MPDKHHRHLPRLPEAAYQGSAFIHWIYCTRNRQTGWLTDRFHAGFRAALLHALHRQNVCCPVYALMPDHMHLMVLELGADSDQARFNRFLRRQLNRLLAPVSLQRQAYDHVLNEREREREAFAIACHYILNNPVRTKLTQNSASYPFLGSLVAGYPELHPLNEGYWELFWKIYNKEVESKMT